MMIKTKDKQCHFCTSNIKIIDYKDKDTLVKFLSPQSKIMPRKKTSVCMKHQRKLANSIKRAREMAILPYTSR